MEPSKLQLSIKEQTSEHHKNAENHPLMQSFITGKYKKIKLLQFLVNIWPVYSVVEQRLLQESFGLNPDLKRTDYISKDIDMLKSECELEGCSHVLTPLEVTDLWVSWCWAKPKSFLKADLYTRWLADFYGGRVLAKSLTPYNNMYTSSNPGSVIKDVRSIIEVSSDEISEEDIIQEVKRTFEFHVELFDEIENE